jgi:hypothetical protein
MAAVYIDCPGGAIPAISDGRNGAARMNDPPPPRQDPKTTIAYAFYAAAIWGLVAYSLWGPKPQQAQSFALAKACDR